MMIIIKHGLYDYVLINLPIIQPAKPQQAMGNSCGMCVGILFCHGEIKLFFGGDVMKLNCCIVKFTPSEESLIKTFVHV